MPPDTRRPPPRGSDGGRKSEPGAVGRDADASTLPRPADVMWLPCRSCDPYQCQPACGRWLFIVDYSVYTVVDLGLTPHDRAACRACQEVGV